MRRNELFYELATQLGVMISLVWTTDGRATAGVDISMSSNRLWNFSLSIAPDDRPKPGVVAGLMMPHPTITDDVLPETKRNPESTLYVSLRRTNNCFELIVRRSGGCLATFSAGFIPSSGGETDKLNVVQSGAWSIIMEIDPEERSQMT